MTSTSTPSTTVPPDNQTSWWTNSRCGWFCPNHYRCIHCGSLSSSPPEPLPLLQPLPLGPLAQTPPQAPPPPQPEQPLLQATQQQQQQPEQPRSPHRNHVQSIKHDLSRSTKRTSAVPPPTARLLEKMLGQFRDAEQWAALEPWQRYRSTYLLRKEKLIPGRLQCSSASDSVKAQTVRARAFTRQQERAALVAKVRQQLAFTDSATAAAAPALATPTAPAGPADTSIVELPAAGTF